MKGDLGDILGDKIKIRMILSLYDFGSMSKTDLYSRAGRNNLNPLKLEELESLGLVAMKTDPFDGNRTTVSLTDLGNIIAKRLRNIEQLISGEPESDVEMDYETPPTQRSPVGN